MDRSAWPQARPTFQPARRRLPLLRWLVVMLIVAAAAFATWSLIASGPNPRQEKFASDVAF